MNIHSSPYIKLHTNLSTPYLSQLPNTLLQHLATTNWLIEPHAFGIANDFVHKLYDDCNGLQVSYKKTQTDKLNMVYVSPQCPNEIYNLINTIAAFNTILKASLTIYCSAENSKLISQFSNDHIKVIDYKSKKKQSSVSECDVLITHGSAAIHFIKQQVPVVIIGHYGFAGLVTPFNFSVLLQNGFAGRAGGQLGEKAPAALIFDELLSIPHQKNLTVWLQENKTLADKIDNKPLSTVAELERFIKGLKKDIYHSRKRWLLIPKIVSNIELKEADEAIYAKRAVINDTVLRINKQSSAWVHSINNKLSCKQLFEVSNAKENFFWDCLYSLYSNNVISFRYAI